MSAPERADARANRQRIIQAALSVLAEKGAAAEIKEVAERAGVGVGTIYRNFATKDDLLRGILDDVIEQYMAIHDRALAVDDPVAGIRLFAELAQGRLVLAGGFDIKAETPAQSARKHSNLKVSQ